MLRRTVYLPAWLALCLFMAASCVKPAASETKSKMAGPVDAVPVRIGTVVVKPMPVQIAQNGTVEPISTVQVKAQVSGPVTEVLFEEGDMVERDQVLFIIDKRPLEVALRQAEANLSRTQAQLEQARATLARDKAQADNAEAVFQRDQMLIEKKMVSQEEFDQTKAQAEAARATVAADEANVKSAIEALRVAKADIEEAKLQLDYCTIRAPIAGRTGNVMVKLGNLVRANDTTPMVVINQLAPIYVTFAVPERHLGAIQSAFARGPVRVTAAASEDHVSTGLLTFVDNTVDPDTGTIRLKATFDNQDNQLWPGQFVRVVVQVAVQDNAVVVPSRAVQTGQQGPYVYVVTPDMTAQLRNIVAGDTLDDLTIIQEGLTPEEKIVTDGQSRLAPDTPVRILTDEPVLGAPAA